MTTTPEIAVLFATYDYSNDRYIDTLDEVGVIYRIRVDHTAIESLADIKRIDSFSMPFYLDGTTVLALLGQCDSIDEAIVSYREFQFQDCYLKTQTDIELDTYRFHRPLEILRLPRKDLEQGRVFRQKAGLIFPDLMFDQRFDPRITERKGIAWKGNLCIEDLASADNVETFHFLHCPKARKLLNLKPSDVFPTKDPIKEMLCEVFTGLFGTTLLSLDREQGVALAKGDEEGLLG